MDKKIINATSSRRYFFLHEPNLMRPECFRDKENLVKCKGKITSREYTFILFLISSGTKIDLQS